MKSNLSHKKDRFLGNSFAMEQNLTHSAGKSAQKYRLRGDLESVMWSARSSCRACEH